MSERSVDEPTPTSGQYPALYMVLVAGLVAGLLIVIVGTLALSFVGKEVPRELIALAGVIVGFLGGLLVPSPKA